MALDEVTQVCPVDLPVMLSDSAGKGVLITAVAHSVSQLENRWGKHGADTIWSTCGTKVLLGSISDPDTLERASKVCGTAGDGDDKAPVVPPELLRMLPDWWALVIRMNLRPVIVKVRPVWRRLAYRLGRHPLPVPVPRPFPARSVPVRPAPAPQPAGAPAQVPAMAQPGPHLARWPDRPACPQPRPPTATATGTSLGAIVTAPLDGARLSTPEAEAAYEAEFGPLRRTRLQRPGPGTRADSLRGAG